MVRSNSYAHKPAQIYTAAECMATNSKFGFCLKKSEVQPIGLYSGPVIPGTFVHRHNFFGVLIFSRNWRNRRFSAKKIYFAKVVHGTVARIFIPDTPLGSPYSALEKLPPTPKTFRKFRKKLFGGGPPRGAWGQNLSDRPQLRRELQWTHKTISMIAVQTWFRNDSNTRKPRGVQIKLVLSSRRKARGHSGLAKKWKFWNFGLWGRFRGAVAPEPLPPERILLQILIL